MADTKHPHPPVEGDGISYRGIIWFVIILTLVTVTCQLIIWVLLRAMQHQAQDASTQAAPLAPAVTARQGEEGRVYPNMVAIGNPNSPSPRLLVKEPQNLADFRAEEEKKLTTYEAIDKETGTYRIPIDRAKELLLERGLPVRGK